MAKQHPSPVLSPCSNSSFPLCKRAMKPSHVCVLWDPWCRDRLCCSLLGFLHGIPRNKGLQRAGTLQQHCSHLQQCSGTTFTSPCRELVLVRCRSGIVFCHQVESFSLAGHLQLSSPDLAVFNQQAGKLQDN